jgi:hypothetical protein
VIFGNNEKENLPLQDEYISAVDKCKNLGHLFSTNGNSNKQTNNRVNKGRNVTWFLNSILWDKSLRKITKKRIYKTMVQSVMTYGADAWDLSRKNRNKLLATEIDYLQWSCRRTNRIHNETIRGMLEMEKDIIDKMQKIHLIWLEHTNRMQKTKWPRKVLTWVPQEKHKQKQPRWGWKDNIKKQQKGRVETGGRETVTVVK